VSREVTARGGATASIGDRVAGVLAFLDVVLGVLGAPTRWRGQAFP
jgi:hypothetical protein